MQVKKLLEIVESALPDMWDWTDRGDDYVVGTIYPRWAQGLTVYGLPLEIDVGPTYVRLIPIEDDHRSDIDWILRILGHFSLLDVLYGTVIDAIESALPSGIRLDVEPLRRYAPGCLDGVDLQELYEFLVSLASD